MMPITLAESSPSILQDLIFGGTGASEAAAWSDGLFLAITWFSIISFVIVMGAMFYFVVKYRRRPGVPAERSPHHHTLLEIVWTVVPSASLLVFFVLGFQGYAQKVVMPDSAMELKIDAWKWAWQASYPNGATSPEVKLLSQKETESGIASGLEYPIFYVPEDTQVKLRMHSRDVIHSFWIPDFRVKMDVIPNRYTGYSFHTPAVKSNETVRDPESGQDIPGRDMWIFCAEYCGDEHSRMAATLRVVPREIYDKKIKEWGRPKSPMVLGEQIWRQQCKICHSIDGSPGTGPTWQNKFGHDAALNDGSSVERDANYIRESILNPNAKIVQGYAAAMPSFQGQLNDEDIDGLIAFIKAQSDRGGTQDGDAGSDGGAEGSDG